MRSVWPPSRGDEPSACAFKTLRNSIGGAILLIRTVLSFTIEVEIDGVAPWRKALTTGPEVLMRATREARAQPGAG